MIKLNANNFLLWEGDFNEAPFDIIAANYFQEEALEQGFIQMLPLTEAIATFGINFASFELLTGDNAAKPHLWDPVTGTLTYYPAPDTPLFTPIVLTYRFSDLNGNVSNIANITMEFF